MCGIIGGYGGMDPETARRMMGRVAHRGPDDDGLVEVAGNLLGHRRLSIVDVEGGKQPLATPDGSLYLVGNGEVYNHEEIRGTLKDGELKTHSDNEVTGSPRPRAWRRGLPTSPSVRGRILERRGRDGAPGVRGCSQERLAQRSPAGFPGERLSGGGEDRRLGRGGLAYGVRRLGSRLRLPAADSSIGWGL